VINNNRSQFFRVGETKLTFTWYQLCQSRSWRIKNMLEEISYSWKKFSWSSTYPENVIRNTNTL